MPPERRSEFQSEMALAAKPYDGLLKKHSWLDTEAATSGGTEVFANVRRAASKKQCKQAEVEFSEIVASLSQDAPLSPVIAAGTAIDRCLRSKAGVSGGIQFWKSVLPIVQMKFLFRGQAAIEQRIAVLEWSTENLAESKRILQILMEKSVIEKDRFSEAKALYTLGRIAEDEKDHITSVSLFSTYVQKFSDLENFEAAFMSLVTLMAMEKRWDEVQKPINSLITSQTELNVDQRSTGALSFAYFWSGRAYFEKEQFDMAFEMWRRVATEYYSTFYGALGHFLLEKNLAKSFALEPSRTSPFRADTIRAGFVGKDRGTFDRASALLKIGRKSEASCEIAEIDTSDKSPERTLAKALLLHASGEWLDAIKLFDGIPRSYRNSLPLGVERILFPRNYSESVVKHSAQLGMDPDIVFALIRQESVYNPRAQSMVGALGLMQLMPATARMEAGRLGTSYLPAARRKEISRAVRSAKGILETENNIALGVHHFHRLLSKYKSPVFALSAYNASPKATEKWLKTIPSDDILVFIERIPYAETKAYVKLILRNYFYYKRWYDAPGAMNAKGAKKEDYRHLMAVAANLIAKPTVANSKSNNSGDEYSRPARIDTPTVQTEVTSGDEEDDSDPSSEKVNETDSDDQNSG